MLRDPPQGGSSQDGRRTRKKGRFQIVKLEERIVPNHRKGHYPGNCHYNPNAGKYVGCGKPY